MNCLKNENTKEMWCLLILGVGYSNKFQFDYWYAGLFRALSTRMKKSIEPKKERKNSKFEKTENKNVIHRDQGWKYVFCCVPKISVTGCTIKTSLEKRKQQIPKFEKKSKFSEKTLKKSGITIVTRVTFCGRGRSRGRQNFFFIPVVPIPERSFGLAACLGKM